MESAPKMAELKVYSAPWHTVFLTLDHYLIFQFLQTCSSHRIVLGWKLGFIIRQKMGIFASCTSKIWQYAMTVNCGMVKQEVANDSQ